MSIMGASLGGLIAQSLSIEIAFLLIAYHTLFQPILFIK